MNSKKQNPKNKKALEKETQRAADISRALMNMLEDVEAARKAMEDERNRISAIIASLADGLMVFDREDRLTLINPQTERFFKIQKETVVGKTLGALSTLPKLKPLTTLLLTEEKVFRKELKVGKNTVLEITTVSMAGAGQGFIIILHDVSREKVIESMKTEFVSLAAHQLRTPLSAIKWTLTMILEGDVGKITPEQKDLLEKTYKSNERMITLINDLLDVTRIEEGRYVFQPVFTDLDRVINFVLKSQQDLIQDKNLKVEFKTPKTQLPKVLIDVEKIRLVIQNLLDNAIRYTPEKGKITITLQGTQKEVECSIQDTGIGIPKDQQKRIFSKFFRSVNAIRLETEGSGLGLFLAKNIIEAHGGKIWFKSTEGKGSTFYFSLPVKKQFEEFLKEF